MDALRYSAEDPEDCIMVGPDGFLIVALPVGKNPKEHAGAFCDAAYIALANPTYILSVLEELSTLKGRLGVLTEAIDTIAFQKIGDEIGDETARDNADYEFAYNAIVGIARDAAVKAAHPITRPQG